ncbi:carboxylesterase/lipase family protein [Stakelama sp. CBK3Z-3]|uniref:Carboxylesterase/lipase family protein n=1 Tax=Stakelama flava TaxID=2860338 RepID=A0ABS6XN34_9SPHN|nr:carboxylesterase/lipase family protein [Stakelama flava]MBW4331617.1 carboxylesterase/lipase family protein [Stakelama flava]
MQGRDIKRGWQRRDLIGGVAGIGAVAAIPQLAKASDDPTVDAPTGRYRGTRESGLSVFRGIRYGQDTSGRRFQAPLAPAPTRDVQQATRFAASCPQAGDHYADQSEDCLFLNIWTPGADPRAKRPVLLYIHGGAYSSGSVVDPLNYGDRLAAHGDAVVVTVNHRLNALGYLYLARLDPRFADSGNVGQLDLILALKWVRANIAAFGGDPDRVLAFGQSGGGAKIATMMGMPAAKGLFQRAATMSGQQVTASGPLNASERTSAYLDAVGVNRDHLSPLLSMPVEKLMSGLDAVDPVLGGHVYFGPVLDMKWLTRHPFWPDANPQSNAMPMILGNTHDETRAFIPPGSEAVRGLTWDNLPQRMAPQLRIDILPEWVVAQYREHFPQMTPTEVFYAATTAGRSWRGQVIEAEARARADTPTWVYQLNFASPVEPERGAPHALDIPLVFGTLDAAGSITGTGAAAQRVSRQMMDAFLACARSGDPNHAGLGTWARYSVQRRETMVFDTRSGLADDPRRWQRELFARVPYIQPGS